ncbi:MAG: TlyA family RNA methyltransferase [Clostridia bacterium]|nr:TlyA family RNA methyltransferase [Deltaproteobacteria bacterium]
MLAITTRNRALNKQRADLLIVEQGLAETRNRAQALILAGSIVVVTTSATAATQERRVDKAGEMLPADALLRLKGEPLLYVSRGGVKLAKALDHFAVEPRDRTCLDIGASTGGFTDCLLQRGALKVYAVDVGYNQLAWQIRENPKVAVIERENIRTLDPALIPEPVSLVVIDVSFISLALVIPHAVKFMIPGAELVALVKPQFEVGKGEVGKGGIVRDPQARTRAVQNVGLMIEQTGFTASRTIDSPILGAKGNHEFLLHARFG